MWTASTRHKGYGAFACKIDGKTVHDRAHRYSWRLTFGDIPNGIFVLHRCDNPACVNPAHLFLGTNQDNIDDMMAKDRHAKGAYRTTRTGELGRYKRGERHHIAKLTSADVLAMRRDREEGMAYSKLAQKYKIGIKNAWMAVNGKTWKHVGKEDGE